MAAQTQYNYQQRPYLEGARATAGRPHDAESYDNPISAQVSTVTFGGTTADGNYDLVVEQAQANPLVIRTTRTGGTPATDTDLALALRDDINTNYRNLASATSAAGVVTITFKHAGIAYTLTGEAPAGATLTPATTTQPGGSFVRVGMWVRRVSGDPDRKLTPIATGTTAAELLGIAERTHFLINGRDLSLDYDAYRPGDVVSAGRSGQWAVPVVSAVTPDSTPFVWIDETDPTGHVGQMTGVDPGGGEVIDVSSLGVKFITSAPAGGIAVVQITQGA